VEQEIAIAAFISQALEHPMRVRAYVHESILREGLRDKLHLNPKSFREDSQVLDDLTAELPSWQNLLQPQRGKFEVEHTSLAKVKLSRLSEPSRNLVIYLLHHGKTEATELMKKCEHQDQFSTPLLIARRCALCGARVGDSIAVYRGSSDFESFTGFVFCSPICTCRQLIACMIFLGYIYQLIFRFCSIYAILTA
jgi:hypothetical protein